MERDWSSWPQEYYSTTDRDERKKLLQERLESGTADGEGSDSYEVLGTSL